MCAAVEAVRSDPVRAGYRRGLVDARADRRRGRAARSRPRLEQRAATFFATTAPTLAGFAEYGPAVTRARFVGGYILGYEEAPRTDLPSAPPPSRHRVARGTLQTVS